MLSRKPVIRLLPRLAALIFTTGLAAWYLTPSPQQATASELKQLITNPKDQSQLAKIVRMESGEHSARQIAVTAMPCFWSGEGFYGAIDGVLKTTPGMIGGDEVVEVEFDPQIISYRQLISRARTNGMATHIYCRTAEQFVIAQSIAVDAAVRSDEPVRADEYPKWYILQTPLKSVPMTPAQSCRINAALHARQDVSPYLIQGQKSLYEKAKSGSTISEDERESLRKILADEVAKLNH